MGFWSGLSLIKLESDLDSINLFDYSNFIIHSDFAKKTINFDNDIYLKNNHISIGTLKDEFSNLINRAEGDGNEIGFYPAFVSLTKGIINHFHITDDALELSGVELSFSGQGYPFPWEVEDVKKNFYKLPEFNKFIDSFTKKFPSNIAFEDNLKNTEPIKRFASFPSNLNNWYWFLGANG